MMEIIIPMDVLTKTVEDDANKRGMDEITAMMRIIAIAITGTFPDLLLRFLSLIKFRMLIWSIIDIKNDAANVAIRAPVRTKTLIILVPV